LALSFAIFTISERAPSSREIVYCKLKWIICRADFHFDYFLSFSLLLTTKERYRCLGTRRFPFKCG